MGVVSMESGQGRKIFARAMRVIIYIAPPIFNIFLRLCRVATSTWTTSPVVDNIEYNAWVIKVASAWHAHMAL